VKTGGIDSSRIEAMIAQLKAAATKPQTAVAPLSGQLQTKAVTPSTKVDFSEALQSALGSVDSTQKSAEALGQRFTMGDDSVSLSDVMISTQKASISLQASLQVRNKMVSAYHEIMNMQV
jgi:flagellar hook-basal body complex protein FliE